MRNIEYDEAQRMSKRDALELMIRLAATLDAAASREASAQNKAVYELFESDAAQDVYNELMYTAYLLIDNHVELSVFANELADAAFIDS